LHFHLVQGGGGESNPRPKASNEEMPSYFSGWLLTVKICYVEFAQNRNVFGTPQKTLLRPERTPQRWTNTGYAGIGLGCC